MDMAEFYKANPEMCVSDLTKGKRVQIQITEYEKGICKKIRRQSGYAEEGTSSEMFMR